MLGRDLRVFWKRLPYQPVGLRARGRGRGAAVDEGGGIGSSTYGERRRPGSAGARSTRSFWNLR